jgi:hypothetical protein
MNVWNENLLAQKRNEFVKRKRRHNTEQEKEENVG